MTAEMISVLLRDLRSLSNQQARLSANVETLERRLLNAAQIERREADQRLRSLRQEMKTLDKKIDTQPIAFRQLMDTWWLRLAAILALGAANLDLKDAIALVLQFK